MYHHESSAKTFFAAKSFFVESGTYQAPALRTYHTKYDDTVVQQYLSNTDNGTKIVPNAFANISSSILEPSAAPNGMIMIENGWTDRRMTFIIEVIVPDHFNGDSRSVVLTGYTNHTDISPLTKTFDPNMRLYFNTSTIISTITQRIPGQGLIKRRVMLDSSHLLDGNAMSNNIQMTQHDPYNQNTVYYATPRNVINEMNNINNRHLNNGMFDFRANSGAMDLQRSRRENAVPTTYLSKILRGVHSNTSDMYSGMDDEENTSLTNAAAGVSERFNEEDPVLMEILYRANYNHQGFATWGQLCSIIPNLNTDDTKFSTRSSKLIQSNVPDADAGNFSNWTGVGYETVIANSIAQLVPALMTSCMIGTINVVFTNDNITMTPSIVITGGQTMIDGVQFSQVSPQFESRFLTEISPQITSQGTALVNMIIQCALGTETFISISRNGGPEVPFCAPTFCDALYTPILSTTQQGLTDIASDLQNIANSVHNAQTAARYTNSPMY